MWWRLIKLIIKTPYDKFRLLTNQKAVYCETGPSYQRYYDEISIGNNVKLRDWYNWEHLYSGFKHTHEYSVSIYENDYVLGNIISYWLYMLAYFKSLKYVRINKNEMNKREKENMNQYIKDGCEDLDRLLRGD